MARPLVLVTAPVATRSGYGAHARDIVRSLIKIDKYDIKIMPVRWGSTPQNALTMGDLNDQPIIDRLLKDPNLPKQPEIHIHIVVPNEFQPFAKYNIGITAGIETTTCAPEWLDGCNRMNIVMVPSQHAKAVFEKTFYDRMNKQTNKKEGELRCTTPIEVLFEGADTKIYKTT